MKKTELPLKGLYLLEPKVFEDERGFFLESYNKQTMNDLGFHEEFVQDNRSMSYFNVLRGLHYQVGKPQAKLVQVINGEITDTVLDTRLHSSTYGEWYQVSLSGKAPQALWVPPGVAHGFVVRSDKADVVYKTTAPYSPKDERTILWNSAGINWGLKFSPTVSQKDQQGNNFMPE